MACYCPADDFRDDIFPYCDPYFHDCPYLFDDSDEDDCLSCSTGQFRIKDDNVFEWKIEDVFFEWTPNREIRSPEFYHEGISWEMKVFPCGRNKNRNWRNTSGWFEIALCARGPPDVLDNKSLSIRFNVNRYLSEIVSSVPKRRKKWYVTDNLMRSMDLMKYVDFDGQLIVQCKIQNEELAKSESESDAEEVEEAFIGQVYRSIQASTSSDGDSNGPSTSQNCTKENGDEKHAKANTSKVGKQQSALPKGVAKALQDYKELLSSEMHSNVIIKVQDKEFKVHRNILAARTPVFAAMLEHNMKEKATGVVTIEDMDPEAFPDFLEYLYTGQVQNLSSDNVLELFTAADKYQVMELREECFIYMKENLSVENFCGILSLVIRHHEQELIALATQFFIKNAVDIVKLSDWQIFMSENLVAANELFIKQLEFNNQNQKENKAFKNRPHKY